MFSAISCGCSEQSNGHAAGKSQRLDICSDRNGALWSSTRQTQQARAGQQRDRESQCASTWRRRASAKCIVIEFHMLRTDGGITNAMNLAQKGVYKELQSIQPGGIWQESFWIKPSGF
jgi:hypothetical protein